MPYRIVQITDCHLFADRHATLRDIATWPRFEAVLAAIEELSPAPELIVITGDTAHDEQVETYQRVREVFANRLSRLKMIPGNHDNRDALVKTFPESCGLAGDRVHFVIDSDAWRLIGLYSQIPGEVSGLLGVEQLDWFRNQLTTSNNRHIGVFVHHQPVDVGSSWLDAIGLQDGQALLSIAAEYPAARFISAGHVHQEFRVETGSTTVLTTPAVGPQFRPRSNEIQIQRDEPPAFRIFDLDADGSFVTTVWSI